MTLLILAALLAGACPAADMKLPPAVPPMKPYKISAREQWTLKNGLEVVLVSDRRFPMLTARLAFRSGDAALDAQDAGLGDAMTALLTDGTSKHGSKEISDIAEEYGGTIDAGSNADDIELESYCLSEHADKMLELMAEVSRSASFPEKEVALRKKNMQEELNLNRGESDFLAGVAFYRKLFGPHPYAVTAPTDASIARITRAAVVKARDRLITPKNAVFVLVGDIDRPQAAAALEKYFGSWDGPAGPAETPAAALSAAPRQVYLVDRPEGVQTSLFLGNLAVGESHPDYFNLLIANQALGGSFSSRLVQDVREKLGYTYSIGSRIDARLSAAIFRIKTPVRTEVTGPALEAIFDHLERIRKTPVTAQELEKAKSFIAGSFARSMETQDGVANAVMHIKLHRLPEDFYDTYVERIQAVTAQGALKAAADYIRPEKMTLVAVGNAGKIRAALEKFSSKPILSVDKDGN